MLKLVIRVVPIILRVGLEFRYRDVFNLNFVIHERFGFRLSLSHCNTQLFGYSTFHCLSVNYLWKFSPILAVELFYLCLDCVEPVAQRLD